MNLKSLVVLVIATGFLLNTSLGQTTESPKVEEQSASYVKIKRVELTEKYTIIHLQFIEQRALQSPAIPPDGRRIPPGFEKLLPMPGAGGVGSIWLDPETRLYKPGDINTKFKLIKAENIPTVNTKKVSPGEKVDFVAYFERLPPGLEEFDFYEGRSQKGQQSWNFYGVKIKNPSPKPANENRKSVAKREVPAKKIQPVAKDEVAAAARSVPEPKDEEMAVVRGNVYDAKTRQLVPAQISYVEKGDSLLVKSSSGKYRIGIDPNDKYDFHIVAKGYYSSRFEVSPMDSLGRKTFNKDFLLNPLAIGETIALPNIYFETSEFSLLPESFAELDRLVQMMGDNPDITIRVEGHTDNVGDADKNLELSRRRAESVRDYLIKKGIDEKRIEARGLGATRPLSKSGSENERRKNRRVEFVITKT